MLQPITTQRSVTANTEWLGGRHGTDDTDTITLDIARFTTSTHYVPSTDTSQPYSLFRSGVPVGKITASGLCGPFDKAVADGRQVLAGFVLAETLFVPTMTKVPVALLWHGTVRAAKVPGCFTPADVTSTNALIRYV
ncbi:head decoration protein [Streptomyces sp. WAC01280]|uniref:head decoration protein n=1 Tax=Streptomyces sp. WAC01280 TaxID=2487424 RepID=UPI000F7A4440|nr:head decoration protein [Streptomyces sp. WAC01280]RSS57524.1 head decoration protein [Streptomyces sp. WAC01280]